jgi:hypothetical protein
MLDRDRGEHGIHDQRTGRLAPPDNVAQYVPVPLAGLENASNRLGDESAVSASDTERGRSNVDLLQFSGKPI